MKKTRLIIKVKQDKREMKTVWNDLRSSAYKVSLILYDLNKKGLLKLEKFNNNASKVVNAVNEPFNVNLLAEVTSYLPIITKE